MRIRFISLLILLIGFCTPTWAQQNCLELFSMAAQSPSQTRVLSGPELDNIKLPILKDKEITIPQIRDFSGPNGSLSLLLKLHFRHEALGVMNFVQNMYFAAMGDAAYSIHHTRDLIAILSVQRPHAFKNAKKGDWPAKKILYSTMFALQTLMRIVYNDPHLNLLTAEGLLKVYGVTNPNDLPAKVAEVEELRLSGLGNAKPTDPREEAYAKLVSEIDATASAVATGPVGIASVLRLEVYVSQVESLIQKLHLSKERSKYYLELVEESDSTFNFNRADVQTNRMNKQLERLNIYIQAFVEKFPSEASTPVPKRMTSVWFLNAVKKTEQFQRIYDITELRLDENLAAAESLNEQLALLLADVDAALVTETRLKLSDENLKNEIVQIQTDAKALLVKDLTTEDLSMRFNELHWLQYHLSETVEKLVSNVEAGTIQEYSELNFKWSRVVEGKSYDIKGRDYDHVVFEKGVIAFFKHELALGDRALAALQKSYVGAHGQSGLRAVTEIHKDLRYIKFAKGRKVRVIGKLIGRTIYFFEMYTRDENFDQTWLHNLIENHTPK